MKLSSNRGIIYARYALPCVMSVLLFVLMLIPCYRFITADGIGPKFSLFELMGNMWEQVRTDLFGSGEKNAVSVGFARTVMLTVIGMWILFIIGAASAVYALISAVKYFGNGCRDSRARVLFVTLTANRVVLCILHSLMLPIFLFPKILAYLISNNLASPVTAVAEPFDIGFLAVLTFAIVIAFIVIGKKHEVLGKMNIYSIHRVKVVEVTDKEQLDPEPKDAYELMTEKSKQEQAERIWRLLNKDSQAEDKDKNEEEDT